MLRRCSLIAVVLLVAVVASLEVFAAPAGPMTARPLVSTAPMSLAQFGPGGLVNPARDCQTIRTCRFERGGSFRGCLSTYTCRTCRLVESRCSIGGRSQVCREVQCGWGG
jgi:hypothetical protein